MATRNISIIATIFLAVFIAAVTLDSTPPKGPGGSDKLYHFLAFTGLALPMTFARPKFIVWIVIIAVAYGGLIEGIQPAFGRATEIGDLIANTLGAIAGATLGYGLAKFRIGLTNPSTKLITSFGISAKLTRFFNLCQIQPDGSQTFINVSMPKRAHRPTPMQRVTIMRLFSYVWLMTAFVWQAVHAETLELHIDADYSISTKAAVSIEDGIRAALAEVDGQVAGFQIEVIAKDHRGSVRRSRRTMEEFLENDRALALIGGVHSPPYLTHQNFINENAILTLLPWSAASAITRSETDQDNWFFRLSVDDLKTAPFFVHEALDRSDCTHVGLILVDTGWGRGNLLTLTAAFDAYGSAPVFSQFFDTGISSTNAALLAQEFNQSGADCAILLANWDNGAELVLALHNQNPEIRIFSHWGIMGGRFEQIVPHVVRTEMNLSVLQTCGLRQEASGNASLLNALQATNKNYLRLTDVPASTGFVHGYDLTRILIAALEQASITEAWQGDIIAKRMAVRDALEYLDSTVDGILKTYARPFSPYTTQNADSHEALGLADLCLARFDINGNLTLIQ